MVEKTCIFWLGVAGSDFIVFTKERLGKKQVKLYHSCRVVPSPTELETTGDETLGAQ